MESLATKLAEYQQDISKAIVDAQPPATATTWAGVVSNAAIGTDAVVLGGVAVATGVGSE